MAAGGMQDSGGYVFQYAGTSQPAFQRLSGILPAKFSCPVRGTGSACALSSDHMRLFNCHNCGQILFFDNYLCTQCGAEVAFLSDQLSMAVVRPAPEQGGGGGVLEGLADRVTQGINGSYRHCRNRIDFSACNWAVPTGDADDFCLACRLNAMIPDLSDSSMREAWMRIERAKRRWLYTVLNLGLPVVPKSADPAGLSFFFLADTSGAPRILTGHEEGRIIINVVEANDAARENVRMEMQEGYRTLIGHFRHESGHYYWDRIVRDDGRLERFREVFGDERADYTQALGRYHQGGPAVDWAWSFVSAYATSHPWEDWAETWAHYLHMVETLETAHTYGISLRPSGPSKAIVDFLEVSQIDLGSFDAMLAAWIPLTVAFNAVNRGMGLPDFYPFVTPAEVARKLRFVYDVVSEAAQETAHPGLPESQTVRNVSDGV